MKLPDDLDMTPRDALEYARMAAAYRKGMVTVVEFARMYWTNVIPLAEDPAIPFKRPRTNAATERAMTDEEIAAAIAPRIAGTKAGEAEGA